TRRKFSPARRGMAGPPSAMSSTASARVQPALPGPASNGYRFSTSRSIGAMPRSASTASSTPARPSRPPCTTGCRVLTRPSIISGNPVTSLTSRTCRPASRIALAVPPVDNSSTPRLASARASSTSPVLSETESSARRIFTGGREAACMGTPEGGLGGRRSIAATPGRSVEAALAPQGRVRAGRSGQAVLAQLLAQRGAVDAEHLRGAALVAVAVGQHLGQQGDLELGQRDLVQVGVGALAHVAQVAAHGDPDVFTQRRAAPGERACRRRRRVAIGYSVQGLPPMELPLHHAHRSRAGGGVV